MGYVEPTRKPRTNCTPAMYHMLNNLVNGRDPWHGIVGAAASGGGLKTLRALYDRSWTDNLPYAHVPVKITAAGRKVHAEETRKKQQKS